MIFFLCPGRAVSCRELCSLIMVFQSLGIFRIGFQLCLLCTENSLFSSVFLLTYQRWWFLNYLFVSAYTLAIIASQRLCPSALLKPCLGTNLSNWSLINGQRFGSKITTVTWKYVSCLKLIMCFMIHPNLLVHHHHVDALVIIHSQTKQMTWPWQWRQS